MSIYRFIASNKPLKEISKGFKQINKNNFIINEKELLNITNETYDGYYSEYTNKQNVVFVEGEFKIGYKMYNKKIDVVLEYIKEHLVNNDEIEIWNIWMDDKNKEVTKTYCKLKDLNRGHIINIWCKDDFNYPECLTIYK